MNKLFEAIDKLDEFIANDDYKVINYKTENTGGNTMVTMGKLNNGQYFGINDEALVIYDEDYHQAYLDGLTAGETNWEMDHQVDVFYPEDEIYQDVLNQINE